MANKYWVGGAGTWNTTLTTNWRTTSGGSTVAAVPTAADSVIFDANSGGTFAVTMTGALACLDITVSTGGVVTFNTGTTPTLSVASNMAIDGGTVWNSTGTITFTATTAKTISTNGAVINAPITFNGTGGSWQLATSLTCSSTTTLTAGTLNLNGFTLTTGNFASASAVARTIAFGTGNIVCNGSGASLWNTSTVTNLTVTGTPTVNINNNSATASTVAPGACTEAQSFNFNFTTGTYALTFLATAAHTARSVDFTGYNGTWAATSTATIYGSLTFPTSAASASFATTISASAMTFGGTSGSKTINCNSRTINFPIIFNGVGSSWQYTSNMLVNGTITLTNGTIDVNSQTNGLFGISGIIMITGTVTLLNCPSSFTLTHTSGTLNIGSAGTGACTLGAYTFTAGALTLNANLTLSSTGLTWTAGTLTLNSYTLYSSAFVANGATIRAIAFGTGNITITSSGTCWNQTTIGTFTFTGTSNVNFTYASTASMTVIPGIATEAQSLNFNFAPSAAASYSLTFLGTASNAARNVTFSSDFTGTWNATSTCTIYGNLYLGSSMTLTSSASAMTLGGVTSLSKTITSNNKTIPFPITFSGTGSTWVLQDAMTVGTLLTTTLTSGVLNLNDFVLTTGIFSSSGAVARTIAFGSAGNNKISCTYNGGAAASTTTVFTTATATLLTVTGTYPLIQVISDTATTLTYVVASGPSSLGAEANAFSFYFQGSFNLTFLGTAGYVCKDIDFGYNGSLSGTWNATSTGTIYGNVILGPNMALTTSASAMTLGATSGTKTFKSNGKSIPFPITLSGAGSTLQLTDTFSLATVTTAFTHTAGTLDLNAVTCTVGTYATGVGTKSLVFNGGYLYISGSGATAFNNANPLNYTVGPGGGYGYLAMSSATAKTFVGGGSNYDCYFINSGAGALTISGASTYTYLGLGYTVLVTGSNSFKQIGVYGTTRVLTLTAGTTQTITVNGGWAVAGSAGDLTTINSATAGTVANIARNYAVNDANYGGSTDYVSLKDINFTPSSTDGSGSLPNIWWAGSHSTNLGNNFGITFTDWSGLATTSIKTYYIANTSTTSWTTPADWNPANNIVHLIGGGGGGSGSRWTSTTNRAGGGGGGGYTKITNYSSVAGTPTSITIGTAGTAGAAGGSGGAGGTTIFGAYNAGGGSPGTIGATNSTGGTGGVGTTYTGGAGGTGTYSATLAAGSGGGGGGGAAGPLGNGGAGGASFATTTTASVSGGGGGGNGGGSAGTAGAAAVSGKGGNNNAGTGGGATNGAAGTNGGGGASNVSTGAGAVGGFGIDILNTWGGGGGTGGPAQLAATNSLTTAYGAGGAGGGVTTAATVAAQLAGGNGGGGLIVVQYYPLILSPGTPGVGSGFFAFF